MDHSNRSRSNSEMSSSFPPTTAAPSTRASSVMWSLPSTTTSIDGGERRSSRGSVLKVYSPDWKLYTGFVGLCILVFAAAIDGTILVAGLPRIASKISGTTTTQAIWIGASYHLASSIFQPTFVSLSFICGRKPLIGISVLLSIAGSAVAGVSQTPMVLLVGEFLQGSGGGASTALAEVITSDLIPAEYRSKWLLTLNLVWSVGTAAGPVIGASLVDTSIWVGALKEMFRIQLISFQRLIFWLSIGLHLLGGVLSMILNIRLKKAKSMWKALVKFDWIGLVLFTVSFTTILMAISLGQLVYPWKDWRLIVLMIVAFISTLLFLILECFYIRIPLIDLYRLQDLSAFITFITTWLHSFAFWALVFFLPIYYQSVQRLSRLQSSLAILPETATLIPAFVLVGFIIAKTSKYKWILFASWALTCIGTGLLALLDTGTTTTVWVIVSVLAGIGIGAIFAGLVFASQATATAMKQDFAFGVSMLHFFRSCGAAAAITASGTIFQHEFLKRLESVETLAPDARKYMNDAMQLAWRTSDLPFVLQPEELTKFIKAYADGLNKIWLTAVILVIAGTVLCVFAKEFGEHVYVRIGADSEKEKADKNGTRVAVELSQV